MCWRARIVRFPVRVPRSITGPSPRLLRLFVGAQDGATLVAIRVQVRRHAHLEVRASQPRGVGAGARVRLVGGAGGFAGRAARGGHGGGQRGGDGRQSDQTGGGQGRERVAAPSPSSAATASRR